MDLSDCKPLIKVPTNKLKYISLKVPKAFAEHVPRKMIDFS